MDMQEEQLLAAIEKDIAQNRLILPTLPEVAIRVRQLLAQPECSVKQLTVAIGSDAGMAARLLKVANSALNRTGQPIEDLQSAITRLGLNLVRSLVTQLAILQSLNSYSGTLRRQLHTVTKHSMAVGAICHALAAQHTRLDPEQALLAGLVHDIGKLPLLLRLQGLEETRSDTALADRIAQRLHTRVGGMILEAWGLSPELVATATDHEQLGRSHDGPADYVDLVIIANLQDYLGRESSPYGEVRCEEVPAFGRLGIESVRQIATGENGTTQRLELMLSA